MTVVQKEKSIKNSLNDNLFKDYSWFHAHFYTEIQSAIKEFFNKDYTLRFMGLSGNENILFYGDEYFVNKISVTKNADFKVKISSGVVAGFLDGALGPANGKFELKMLTDIEAMLVKSFTVSLYKKLEAHFSKADVTKQALQNCVEYNFTFFVQSENKHIGKLIVVIPDFILKDVERVEREEVFSIIDFKNALVDMNLIVGKSKITLTEIKAIEDGDIIVLENSDINSMSLSWKGDEYKFKVNPDPSLIISVNNDGGNEMEEETSTKSQNMWDSILVDIVAEFDNVKLTLGELKQISEGLVIDVGSVYDHKIKLRVENQIVATGELVILNDRYGVRIDNVKKNSKNAPKMTAEQPQAQTASAQAAQQGQATAPNASPEQAAKQAPPKQPNGQAGDENFDYSDFEIEDESI